MKTAKVTSAHKNSMIEALLKTQDEGRENHFKAPKTIQKYRDNIRRGQEFLAQVISAKHLGAQEGGADVSSSLGSSDINIDEFSHALDDTPNQYSAMALELFLVEKCLNQGRAKSANAISASFCYLWDSQGDKYRGEYKYNEITNTISGNPGRSAAVRDIGKVIKNKHSTAGNPRTHASAMTIEDIHRAMSWSYAQSPPHEAKHLMSLAKLNVLYH
ncbi:hypothetical protein BDN67DRAFT_1016236 [Paxillus ammoniavirescens]|nr:hypothetical protein BDN67DRAFT_1016236 [Paxillus ammoniavirescens]